VAADVTAIILTVVCATIAAWCAVLLLRLWRAGSFGRDKSSQARWP
jgi:hypothetical protein